MKYVKGLLFTVNLAIWLTGCVLIVTGIYIMMEPHRGHLLNLFVTDASPHDTIHTVGYGMVVYGLTILTVGFCGCRAALQRSACVVGLYMGLLVTLIISELIAGAWIGKVTHKSLEGMERRMYEKLNNAFGWDMSNDHDFTRALIYAQYKFNCCGINNDYDYVNSSWWIDNQLHGMKEQVFRTCCVHKENESKNTGSPMSSLSRVFHTNTEKPWTNPQLTDESACQSLDVAVHTPHRNKIGCLPTVKDWLRMQSYVPILFGIAVLGSQVLSVLVSGCLWRTMATNAQSGG
ncbi:hypothetical protein QAD02_010243 [Eretmocerus hayati]|uniref:Uncharacterized protein n=1 Tax=Eretmocerus hayati TaxID=131215 RepID=A0ACC2NG59_9HYME|nr:hypothetical protein QAD02_010243 [Eretmocerus hayati]